jgi:1-hydroxycarotenoid 3,4-desaturase
VAETRGFPLARHSIFFSDDYKAEFHQILGDGRLPAAPTIYICAQDRDDAGRRGENGPERLLCLINAPPCGDTKSFSIAEIDACANRVFAFLERCGLTIHRRPEATVTTTPRDFEALFPKTGGALYGQASHGWQASFRRPGSRTKIPGLYLAGGSVHPGAGVPMAALSGRLAAAALLSDLASTSRSVAAATPGGMSMA